jgi:hypothetical protein
MPVPEPLSEENIALIRAHLLRHTKDFVCPVCGTKEWTITGLTLMYGYVPATETTPSRAEATGVPVVLVVCQTCSFVRQFAWMPIAATKQHV